MIIYSKADIENYIARKGALPPDEAMGGDNDSWNEFTLQFPYPFYSPHFFIRLGLFLLTLLVVLLTTALLWLMFGMSANVLGYGPLFIAMGVGCMLFSEYLARKKKHFQSGADEALHLSATMLTAFGLQAMMGLSWWMTSALMAIFAALFFLRYMNYWMAGVAVVCCMIFLNEFVSLFLPVFMYAIPLAAFALAGSYFSGEKFSRKTSYYETGVLAARYLFLFAACFYTNYLCVSTIAGGRYSTFAELSFYKVTTILLPLALLVYGIIRRDKVLMHVGMISIFFAVYTAYVFLNASQPFLWMAVFGSVVVIITVAVIRWLKFEPAGFSYKPVKKSQSAAWMEVIVSANAPQGSSSDGHRNFGGGDFGGGGASGTF